MSEVCTCTTGSTGFTRDPTSDFNFWVHADCMKPKQLYLERFYESLDGEHGEDRSAGSGG